MQHCSTTRAALVQSGGPTAAAGVLHLQPPCAAAPIRHAISALYASRFTSFKPTTTRAQNHGFKVLGYGPSSSRRKCSVQVSAAQQGNLNADPNSLANLFMQYALQMQQALEEQQQRAGTPQGANLLVQDLGFHPPGSETPLLSGVNMHLPANKLGLVIGRSGSGKTTLLQLLSGLTEQTSGHVYISQQQLVQLAAGSSSSSSSGSSMDGTGPPAAAVSYMPLPHLPPPCRLEQRMNQVGLVFQFPERHFLGDDLMSELTFAWPRTMEQWAERTMLAARLEQVMQAVRLTGIPLNIPPTALSGGQQRRLALAIQLVRQPSLLLLDEPLAGLDWKARAEVVALLKALKQQATLLVVSHDLREISPLVDVAWRMEMGGRMCPVTWPPDSMSDLED